MSDIQYTFSDDRGEKLEHYGVLGMKWGVRKDRVRKTPKERGYKPSKKSSAKAKARYKVAKNNLSSAERQYRSNKNAKNAKVLAKAQTKYDEAKSHKEYVLSGKQAQNRSRALKTASAIAFGSSVVLGIGAATAGASLMADLAYLGTGAAAKLPMSFVSAHLTGAVATTAAEAGQSAVAAVLGAGTGTASKKYKG